MSRPARLGSPSALLEQWWARARPAHPESAAGPAGNRRLTVLTGILLIPLLVVVFISGALLDAMWRVHYFVGFLLIPPLALKAASTGWKALRYYIGQRDYRAAGPPSPALRALGPVLVAAAVLVLVSGVWVWVEHSRSGPWSTVHTDAALVLLGVAAIHLLAHLPGAATDAAEELRGRGRAVARLRAGMPARRAAVSAAVLIGLAVGAATIVPSQAPAHAERHRAGAQP